MANDARRYTNANQIGSDKLVAQLDHVDIFISRDEEPLVVCVWENDPPSGVDDIDSQRDVDKPFGACILGPRTLRTQDQEVQIMHKWLAPYVDRILAIAVLHGITFETDVSKQQED